MQNFPENRHEVLCSQASFNARRSALRRGKRTSNENSVPFDVRSRYAKTTFFKYCSSVPMLSNFSSWCAWQKIKTGQQFSTG